MKNIGELKKSSNGLLIPNQDIVFQALFGTKGSERILGGLLTNILGEKIDNISLEANQNLTREIPENKFGVVDLRANVEDKTTVHIEVQMLNPYNMFKRLLWYWSRIYGSQLKDSEDYAILKKTIAILIVNYDITQLEWYKDAHTVWNMLEKRNTNINIFEDIEIHIIELPKIKKYQNETENGLSTWLEFLMNPESEEVKMSKENDKLIQEAYEKLVYISEDKELRRQADLRLMAILDENSRRNHDLKVKQEIEQGQKKLEEGQKELEEGQKELEEGQKKLEEARKKLKNEEKLMKDEGREETKIEVAKKMLKKNLSIQDIIEMTGLEKDEIEKLQN